MNNIHIRIISIVVIIVLILLATSIYILNSIYNGENEKGHKPLSISVDTEDIRVGDTFNVTINTEIKEENYNDLIWDFGDGNAGKGIMVEHSYSESNYYNILAFIKNKSNETIAEGKINLSVKCKDVILESNGERHRSSLQGWVGYGISKELEKGISNPSFDASVRFSRATGEVGAMLQLYNDSEPQTIKEKSEIVTLEYIEFNYHIEPYDYIDIISEFDRVVLSAVLYQGVCKDFQISLSIVY